MGLRDYVHGVVRTFESSQRREQRERRERADAWDNSLRLCHRCPTRPRELEPIGRRCGGWPVWYMGLPQNRSVAFIPGVRLSGTPRHCGMVFTSSHIRPIFRDIVGPFGYDEDGGDRPFGYRVSREPRDDRGLHDPPAGMCTPSRASARRDGERHCSRCGLLHMTSLHTCLWGEGDAQPRWATMWFVQHGNGVASVVRFEDTQELLDFDVLAKAHAPQQRIAVPESLWLPEGKECAGPETMPRLDHIMELRESMPRLSVTASDGRVR